MSSLAIVEKKPPFNGGGCAGGLPFHLLDWHRRLARKRRLFSPRWILPWSLRSSPRRLPCPPLTPPPSPAPHPATGADGAAPGVVARLMGLESWPASVGGPAAPPRPQKQRKVEASPLDKDSAVVLVLPTSRRPPAPALAPATATRSHHGADLPARSPRRTRLVHSAPPKLLEPGERASSRASARLALAYACSSPQHRNDGHSGALLQGSGMADDFLSRSNTLSLERSTRVQPPVLPAETECDGAAVSRRHKKHSINNADVATSTSTVVLPRMNFGGGNMSKRSSDMNANATRKENRVTTEVMRTCGRIRSTGAAVQVGDERLLRKRATPTRNEVSGIVESGGLAGSTCPVGRARELASAGRRVAHSGSGPRREFIRSITGQGSTPCRDVINRSGLASTSRISSNESGPKRGLRKKVGCDAAANNREDRNAVAFASRSSVKSVARASLHNSVPKSGCPSRLAPDTTCARMPAVDPKCMEVSPSIMATSEKDEFSRLLKAKINELGMSDRIEFTPSDAPSGKLTAPVLQELISALSNDMNPSTSLSSNYSDASGPLSSNGNVGCIDRSGYAFSNDRSPDFQKFYQGEQDIDSSVTSMNNEPKQPSPTSVLEAYFSNDTSSLGSPVEKNEGKDLFVSIENKMEDLFNLESNIVDLAMSIDTRKTGAEEILHSNGKLPCIQIFFARDFKFLESRLHSIGEAISNAELFLGSSLHSTTSGLALHPFIIEMLENTVDVFGGEESSDLTEDKKYQCTNFLFDCIVESLDLKFCNFGKCGYKAWLKSPLSLSKDLLKRQVLEDISNMRESSGTALSRVAEKEVDQVTARCDASRVEAFDICIAIENDILEALVGDFAFDLW
ncbi:uncharacterized protein LOC133899494 [Phragmites australis]|uniref:uncharacterized protein LOC133899494 n=1 Tax=Phragmites australis TaxID=29695 RepID=UPI002D796134|nr:uncharacterized protein LOC133899494 [Phragmites australis]